MNLSNIENRFGINLNPIFIVFLYLIFIMSIFILTETVSIFIVFTLLPILFLVNYSFLKNFNLLLIVISILTLAILQLNFSRNFKWIFIQDIPLFIITAIGTFSFLLSTKDFKIRKETTIFPVVLIFIYSIIMLLIGIYSNHRTSIAFQEFYQHFYYFLAIPLFFLIKKDRYYEIIFSTIIFVLILISLQYILYNILGSNRFTTYHNVFIPFLLGFVLQKTLSEKNSILKIIFVLFYFLIWLSSFLTETRLLWVVNIVTSLSILFFHFVYYSEGFRKNKKSILIKSILVSTLFIMILGFLFIKSKSFSNQQNKSEQRVEAIATPLEDHSFLMRIEISYYALLEFLKNPIVGSGFGSTVEFQLLANTKVAFIDNSFFYFLWKGGIIGFSLFVFLYYRFLMHSFTVLNKTTSKRTKQRMVLIISSFFSFLFYGIFSASLIAYKLNFLYALLIAYVEFERRKLANE